LAFGHSFDTAEWGDRSVEKNCYWHTSLHEKATGGRGNLDLTVLSISIRPRGKQLNQLCGAEVRRYQLFLTDCYARRLP
jgi:hypothetical protein